MESRFDRRSFLKIAGSAVGVAVTYQFAPLLMNPAAAGVRDHLKSVNGEEPGSFTFAQLSDTHVGFQGPPDPLGAKAFERAIDLLNQQKRRPDFVIFTGDLTHDADSRDVHAARMRQFKELSGRIKTAAIHTVPGENDAAIDNGILYREHFGVTHYSFDHKGVHFVALDNVSRGRPEIGAEQLAWLKSDLARFPTTAPIVVFTHRPLFDLKPEWEWFTADGSHAMDMLAPYENVVVLYGHIHRREANRIGRIQHFAARSLIFAFNDPATNSAKKPLPFDKNKPFHELGIRLVGAGESQRLNVSDVELTRSEFSGVSGMQQMIKGTSTGGSFNDID